MLAHNNEYIEEAVTTIYQVSREENIRLQCEAREDYYRQQKDMEHVIEGQAATINKLSSQYQKLTFEHEKLLAWAKTHG